MQTSLHHKRNKSYLACSHNFESTLSSKTKTWYSALEIYLTNVILESVTCDLWCKSQFLPSFMKFLYMHAFCPLPREISANKKKTFQVRTLVILKWMYWNVQAGFQIELVTGRHTAPSDKLLFLPYFAWISYFEPILYLLNYSQSVFLTYFFFISDLNQEKLHYFCSRNILFVDQWFVLVYIRYNYEWCHITLFL